MNKQIHVYSIDTYSFFNSKERNIYNRLIKIGFDKKIILKKVQELGVPLSAYGIDQEQIKHYVKDDSLLNSNNYEDSEFTHIKYLLGQKRRLIDLNSFKAEQIKEKKEQLSKMFKLRLSQSENNSHNKIPRILNSVTLTDNKVVSIFESSLTRTLKIEENTLTNDILIVKIYYFDILKDLIKNGFIYNGEKYQFFTASAGQIRTKKTVFIKQSLWEQYEKVLMCGLSVDTINSLGGININKFLAYLAMSNSATDLWDNFDIEKSIVVDDFETMVNGEVDLIDDQDYSISRIKMDVPITHTDGCGMILPSVSKKNFMIRLPWIKGLLAVFDFQRFISHHKHSPIITDIYGKEHDILKEDIQIIFTKSQFKMYKYYKDWIQYKNFFKEFGCTAGKCNVEENRIPNAKINYQMMQTLSDMTSEELEKIASTSINKLKDLTSTPRAMLSAFGVTDTNTNMSSFQQALKIYPELLQDIYTKTMLRKIKKSMIQNYKSAKLDVQGKYTFIIPDLYAFCEYLFMGVSSPIGLLADGEVFCKLYPRTQKLDCLRSPHLYKEHAVRNNIVNEDKSNWFLTNGVYTSSHDLISKILQFDVDGDKALVVADKHIVDIATRNMRGIVPLYYNMRKADATQINSTQIYDGLTSAYSGGNIGGISNDITKIENSDVWISGSDEQKKELLSIVKLLCMENNFTIDYAKTLYKPTRPQHINRLIRKYTNVKVPHFFLYAKGKELNQVASKNNSLVNQLDELVKDYRLSFKTEEFGKFDYELLMSSPDVAIDMNVISLYKKLNKQYCYSLNMENDYDQNISYIAENIRVKMSTTGYSDNEIADMLVKYLFCVIDSQSKVAFWFSYGQYVVQNLKLNIDTKTSACMKCGGRFEKSVYNQVNCGFCLIWNKTNNKSQKNTMKCIDCGTIVSVQSSRAKSNRCPSCYKEYRKEYKRLHMLNKRHNCGQLNVG